MTRAVVITGASSGIGLAAAQTLAVNGFSVIGIGRDAARCDAAKNTILASCPDADVRFLSADLLSQREVMRAASEISSLLQSDHNGRLHALINNAGCVRGRYMTTDEGYEHQFALNHLASFLLTKELLPFIGRAQGRVIMTGSDSHNGIRIAWDDIMFSKRYRPLAAYKQSKLCNMLFARELNDRYSADGIRAYVVDPGLVRTDIGNKNTGFLVDLVWSVRKLGGTGTDIPAQTYAFLCLHPVHPEGLYYYLSKEKRYSGEVSSFNSGRLFALSEKLCGIRYPSHPQDLPESGL